MNVSTETRPGLSCEDGRPGKRHRATYHVNGVWIDREFRNMSSSVGIRHSCFLREQDYPYYPTQLDDAALTHDCRIHVMC